MSMQEVADYHIRACSCGEDEFLQILPVFNKFKVHCVNCGNRSQAMSTKEKTVEQWNKSNRFKEPTCDYCKLDCKDVICGAFESIK